MYRFITGLGAVRRDTPAHGDHQEIDFYSHTFDCDYEGLAVLLVPVMHMTMVLATRASLRLLLAHLERQDQTVFTSAKRTISLARQRILAAPAALLLHFS